MTFIEQDKLRVFGVEGGSFEAFSAGEKGICYLCGVDMESSRIMAIKIVKIKVDGLDATEKLLNMVNSFEGNAIILGGITFAGFNIVDIKRVHQETGIPVIVYSGKKPDNNSVLNALKAHFKDWEIRWNIIKKAGPIYSSIPYPKEPPVYFEVIGNTKKWAEKILVSSAMVSRIPEPVRVAGIVARGLSPAC